MRSLRLRGLATGALAASLLATVATAAAAQGGTLQGTVTATFGSPLQEARIIVLGTTRVGSSGPDGKYRIAGIPAGTAELRIIRVGYQEQKKSVRILDGQLATLDVVMPQTVVQLQEVVTTATGEQRRVEVGNAVENLSVSKLTDGGTVRTIADVLTARVPGVQIQQGTQTGSGQRIRVRGVSSMSLSNEPIFVIDGIRMTANTSMAFGNGGANFSRLGDISPEDIENIEIVKGPSAATLYGTDAANGVIVITTKKGRTGSTRWNVFAEGGILEDRNWYSDNYTLAGRNPTTKAYAQGAQCTLPMVSLGTCVKSDGTKGYDSLRVYNPINDPDVTPLDLGYRRAAGLQVQGGNETLRYFLSGTRDNEIGVFKLDPYERRKFELEGVTIHPWMERPNTRLLNSFRSAINAALNPQLDAGVTFGYSTIEGLTSNESNNTVGIGSQAFGGPGYRSNGLISGMTDSLLGYRAGTPGRIWQEKLQQNTTRMIASANLNWRPSSWLSSRANFGTDFAGRVDNRLHMNGEGWPLNTTYRDGEARNARANVTNLSADIGATANYNPRPWLGLKTTLGTQYNNFRQDQNLAIGTTLPPGATTVSAGAVNAGTNEATVMTKTWGIFIEESAALRDRLFLTAAVRTDQNSAFGTNFQRVFYPKGSLSWVLSDEDFFPRDKFLLNQISNLRLRVAYGASGVQPGANDALRTFQAGSASIKNTDAPIETFNDIGNPDLKPERSTEWELGFDSRIGNRVQFDVTYYSRLTHDALIDKIIAPSVGSGGANQRANLGSVKNAGFEVTLGGQLLDRRQLGLDFHFTTSLNSNKVVSLGKTPPQIGTTFWVLEGYPINALFEDVIAGWEDKNKDGILTYNADSARNEVFITTDTVYWTNPVTGQRQIVGFGTFRGYAAPRYLTTLTSGIDLFNRKVRIQNLFDWRGGNKYFNQTERIRCTRPNCNGLFNPNASLEEQAMVVAALNTPQRTNDGYFQPGAFVKWREASVTWTLPQQLVSRARGREASLVFAARNLKLWTNYRGSDPESDFTVTGGNDAPSEFQTFSAPTVFQIRLNIGF